MKKIAIVFTGQGSQYLSMGQSLLKNHPHFSTFIKRVEEVLAFDLWNIMQNDAKKLNETQYAQPAILLIELLLLKCFKEHFPTLQIQTMAGHSLGEYAALCAAGCLDEESAIHLVAERGRLMQQAYSNGKMAAVLKCNLTDVEIACKSIAVSEPVEIACINSPQQIVISGSQAGVEKCSVLLKEKGARVVALPVSVPSHCTLMKTAIKPFTTLLESAQWKSPHTSVVNNVDALPETQINLIQKKLIQQLYSPVQWVKSIEYIVQNEELDTIIEIGPKSILMPLNQKIAPSHLQHASIVDDESIAQLKKTLGVQ